MDSKMLYRLPVRDGQNGEDNYFGVSSEDAVLAFDRACEGDTRDLKSALDRIYSS